MNQACQKQLFQQTNQGLLGIRQSEVNYYQGLNVAFGTQAALIGGFTYGVFSQNLVNESNGYRGLDVLTSAYWICSAITIAIAVHVILCTTLMQVLGPGLALNGPVGSMARATEGMMVEQKPIIRAFFAMIIMFSISTVLSCWFVMDTHGAIGCSIVFALSACYWYKYCERIYLRFYWDRDELGWQSHDNDIGSPDDGDPADVRLRAPAQHTALTTNKKSSKPSKGRFSFFKRKTTTASFKSFESDHGNDCVHSTSSGDSKGFRGFVLGTAGTKSCMRSIAMEGYLTKRGGGSRHFHFHEPWERRYFTLTSTGNLFVFKDRQEFRDNPKNPLYTRPLQLEDYYIEVLSNVGDVGCDVRSVVSCDSDAAANPYRFQMTLVLRENVHTSGSVTLISSDSPSEVVSALHSPVSRSVRSPSVASCSSVGSSSTAHHELYRDHWVLRCDTDEELQQWVTVIASLCPSCLTTF